MIAEEGASAEASFAVGHDEICGFLTCLEFYHQPGQPRQSFFLVCARSSFNLTDDVVASGRNLCEPEMSGGVGSGCAEIGS